MRIVDILKNEIKNEDILIDLDDDSTVQLFIYNDGKKLNDFYIANYPSSKGTLFWITNFQYDIKDGTIFLKSFVKRRK